MAGTVVVKRTADLLSEIYKNVKMAEESIIAIMPKVKNEELKSDLTVQLSVYSAFASRAAKLLGEEGVKLGLMAKRSRLNLAVAATSAKKMKDMRKKVNLFSFFAALLGVGIAFLFTMLGWMESVNEFILLLYWFLLSAAFGAIVFTSLPQKDRFSLEAFKREESIENMADSILDIAKDK